MKKIGEIKGVPVVEGDANLVKNQILYKETDKGISLSKRTNGKLEEVSGGNSGKEGSKFYYYCLDLSKYKDSWTEIFSFLHFLNINNFAIPGMGKGNCIYITQRTYSQMIAWAIIIDNLVSFTPEEVRDTPLMYLALNETSEATFIADGNIHHIISKGDIVEQLVSFGAAMGDSDFLKPLCPLFTEITEEEYLAL